MAPFDELNYGLRVTGYEFLISHDTEDGRTAIWNARQLLMKTYRDLEIFQRAYDLAMRVHEMTLRLPRYETYEEGSQVRRSSKGIASCIVEGFGRRRYKSDFIRFLIYAHGSCDETIIHLKFIKYNHESVADEAASLLVEYNELGAKN